MGQEINNQYAPDFLLDYGLSVHAFIDVNGLIILGQPTNKAAYHAGISEHLGLRNLNNYYLSIELLIEGVSNVEELYETMNTGNPYTGDQYKALAYLCNAWIRQYPTINKERITGHSTVSPGRKQDPGRAFKWELLKSMIV